MKHTQISLYKAAQTRELDRIAIEGGVPGYTLMCRAGQFSFDMLFRFFGEIRSLVVVCGIGNNGGDGYVVARLANAIGLPVRVLQLGDLQKQHGEALIARQHLQEEGVRVETFTSEALDGCSVIVDAMFGTGLEREVRGDWARAIEAINSAEAPVLAIDIPSGLHADSGRELGIVVQAAATTTFIGRKQGMFTGKGPKRCGEIFFHDLGVDSSVYRRVRSDVSLWHRDQLSFFSPRSRDAHKGCFGHALLAGGDEGFSGAIRMAGESCLRTGAGLVSILTREAHAAQIAQQCPELMCHGAEMQEDLDTLLDRASVIAVGPGLGRDEWGQALFQFLSECQKPKILDADALNLLAIMPGHRHDWILTPHPGEAARLLECTVDDIEHDRFNAVREITLRYGGVCVLKGSGSLIDDGQHTVVCPYGNPGMASGGSGDVLTGILAALMAQYTEASLFELAQLGVGTHAIAGDFAARAGERGMIARDIINEIRSVVNHVR